MRNRQQDIDLARRMRAQGIPVEIPVDDYEPGHGDPPVGLILRQQGSSDAYELPFNRTGYVLDVEIIPNFPWPFELSAVELAVPWDDQLIEWLPDPQETRAPYGMYWLDSENSAISYEREFVINHHIGHTLTRGRSLRGLLLGIGRAMPADVRHGAEVAAFLNVFDQFDRKYSCGITFWVDRSEQLYKPKRKKPRVPLFTSIDKT
jgi:hypothetical protein